MGGQCLSDKSTKLNSLHVFADGIVSDSSFIYEGFVSLIVRAPS